MSRYAFIYNPAAKAGRSERQLQKLKDYLTAFDEAYLFKSKKVGDITSFVRREATNFDIFVACGGDGTVREVAASLLHTDKKMGIIPMGTGNDLCKTLNIPRNLSQSIEVLRRGNTTAIDVGTCNEFVFLNTIGFGFDGLTNRYALDLKYWPPALNYLIAALKAVINHFPFKIKLSNDAKKTEVEVIMISLANGRVEGGIFSIAPTASITDGKLNCITIRPISKWLIPVLLPFFVIKKPHWIPQLESIKVEKLLFSIPSEVYIHADGEYIKSDSTEFDIQLIPKALEIICNI